MPARTARSRRAGATAAVPRFCASSASRPALWSCREHEPPPIAAALSDAADAVINNDVFPAVKKEETAGAPTRLARTLSALTVFFLRRTSLLLGP